MLEAVGRPVAVNPDRALAKMARERGWEVRNFTKPIRLRDRVGRTTPVVTTSLAVAGVRALSACCGGHAAVRTRLVTPRAVERLSAGGRRPAGAGSSLAQPTGGDDAQSNQQGQDDQLLHGRSRGC